MRNFVRSRSHVRRVNRQLAAMVMALGLLLIFTASAFANTVNIYDNANVLNSSQVRSEASSLSYPVDIYTVTNYTSGNSAFDQSTARKINKNNLIVMAINTTQGNRHVYIKGGSSVSLSSSDYQNAANAFKNSYNNGDYTGAVVAAIRSLRDVAGQGGGALPSAGGIGNAFGTTAFCCIGLLVLAGIAVFVFVRRRNRPGGGGGFFNRNRRVPPYDPYNQQQQYGGPYNQQQYPPNYGNQGGGINPLAAGGLGAAGGAFLGYELGKNAGREEDRDNRNYDDNNNGGNYGGGGGGADFGNDNNGGGADFGGDSGGGGGADFGGGGGDSGGGGGSDF